MSADASGLGVDPHAWEWQGLDARLFTIADSLMGDVNIKRRALGYYLRGVADALEAVRKHAAGDIGQAEEADAIMAALTHRTGE